ncbi:MAG: LysE family transporter [Anaerolineae bacterium]
MDLFSLLGKGLIIGFAIAAPVGPIGVLCIRRTLAFGRLHGLLTGLGAATADAIYGGIAAFGLTTLSALLVDQRVWLQVLGGMFLIYLGVTTLRAPAAPLDGSETGHDPARPRLIGAYLSTLLLTLSNPLTILSFIGVLAGLGVGAGAGDLWGSLLVVGGVFSGSLLWWLLLSGGVGMLRRRLGAAVLLWVNRLSGLVIGGAGALALWGGLRALLAG